MHDILLYRCPEREEFISILVIQVCFRRIVIRGFNIILKIECNLRFQYCRFYLCNDIYILHIVLRPDVKIYLSVNSTICHIINNLAKRRNIKILPAVTYDRKDIIAVLYKVRCDIYHKCGVPTTVGFAENAIYVHICLMSNSFKRK